MDSKTKKYLVENLKIELKYEFGKGAWTYHIQIPNTKHLVGKWGSLKVAGFIDDYEIKSINLFTISGQDKLISINEKIRKSINKTGGDLVNVSLYLLDVKNIISEKEILELFKEANVLKNFEKLTHVEKDAIINYIISSKSENIQFKTIEKYIYKFSDKS